MTLGEKLKKERKSAGLTQAELAKKSGLYDSQIRNYESDRNKPTLKTLIKIAEGLQIPLSKLVPSLKFDFHSVSAKEFIEDVFNDFMEDYVIDRHESLSVNSLMRLTSAVKEFPDQAIIANIPNDILSFIDDDILDRLPEETSSDAKKILGDIKLYCEKQLSIKSPTENYLKLNEIGQKKAYDYIEDLTKIPEYQKKDDNED